MGLLDRCLWGSLWRWRIKLVLLLLVVGVDLFSLADCLGMHWRASAIFHTRKRGGALQFCNGQHTLLPLLALRGLWLHRRP
jgi:hypothetical protein